MDVQNVLVNMTAVQVQDGEENKIELTAEGQKLVEGEKTVLCYEETGELAGQTRIEMEGDTVTLTRTGLGSLHLILKQGCKYVSRYSTLFGDLDVEALPMKVAYLIGEKKGKVTLEYALTMNGQDVGVNRLFITFEGR